MNQILIPKRLDTRRVERLKQFRAELEKQLKTGQVTGKLIEDILNFDPDFNLPNNLTVNSDLFLSGTKITRLPDGLTVNSNLYLWNTKITRLSDDLICTDTIYLWNTPLSKNLELLAEYKQKYKIIY